MNPQDTNRWKSETLDQVLLAFAAHPQLRGVLIFKGARILNLRLGMVSRQSLDIDSNLDFSFTVHHASLADQQEYLQRECQAALERFFENQDPIRYEVVVVRIEMKPADGEHPFGWTGFLLKIRLRDRMKPGVLGLPSIELDVASPETLGPGAVSELQVGDQTLRAYSLERIAGEKLRAFLSSQPAYIAKIRRRTDTRRVKDLYDLARIRRKHPITEASFWRMAGGEFKLACESRFIDCAGLATFGEGLEQIQTLYEKDLTIPRDIDFAEAWETIKQIVLFFERHGIIPFRFELPG
jgi:hypothetical protein